MCIIRLKTTGWTIVQDYSASQGLTPSQTLTTYPTAKNGVLNEHPVSLFSLFGIAKLTRFS